MNLILLFEEDLTGNGNVAELTGRRFEHIKNIHKAKPGDKLIIGMLNGKTGKGLIKEMNKNSLKMEVILDSAPPAPLGCRLILAMPRPLMFKRILMHICSLGVKEIHLINTKRVEKSFWQSPVLEEQNIFNELVLGLEQAKDTILPQVHIHKRFKEFAENVAPGFTKDSVCLVAHPVTGCIQYDLAGNKTIAIGPEGGFINYEVEKFREAGFKEFSMGERILRVETAVPVAISKLCKF